jgi:HD-GYP domain-containing protein (c-di-GMP phosphodiesterase class II)
MKRNRLKMTSLFPSIAMDSNRRDTFIFVVLLVALQLFPYVPPTFLGMGVGFLLGGLLLTTQGAGSVPPAPLTIQSLRHLGDERDPCQVWGTQLLVFLELHHASSATLIWLHKPWQAISFGAQAPELGANEALWLAQKMDQTILSTAQLCDSYHVREDALPAEARYWLRIGNAQRPQALLIMGALAEQGAFPLALREPLLLLADQAAAAPTHFSPETFDDTLFQALVVRHPDTAAHCQRVADGALRLAELLNLPAATCRQVYRAARLHDVGKIGIPDAILQKPDELTDEEWAVIHQHPILGYALLPESDHPDMQALADAMLYHHERWDGAGYPHGCRQEEIPLVARIVALVDAVDALLHDRPYRAAWTATQIHDYLRQEAGRQFDPALVEQVLGGGEMTSCV